MRASAAPTLLREDSDGVTNGRCGRFLKTMSRQSQRTALDRARSIERDFRLQRNGDSLLLPAVERNALPGGKPAETFPAGLGQSDIDLRNLRATDSAGIFKRKCHGFCARVDVQAA